MLKGGPSSEREVSLRSGAAVARGLHEAGYEVVEVDVTERRLDLPKGIDAAFIALHGEFGEDGQVQALLEAQGVPYTGSDPAASRASFDKIQSKTLLLAQNIPTPAYEILEPGRRPALPLPLVIKPASQGSSIGVHRVFIDGEWAAASADAFRYDRRVIAEAYIKGRELTVGIVGAEALPIVEIVAPGDWYSYDAKYTRGQTQYLCPASLDPEMARRCQEVAVRTFRALGCRGLGRVDIRLDAGGTPFVLELNNIPGFTETSLLPKAAAQSGLSFAQLCDRIIGTIPDGSAMAPVR